MRDGGGPLVLEFATHRLGAHSKGDDSRPPHELRHAREQDWYPRYAARFPEQFAACDAEMRAQIESVAAEVTARPPCDGPGEER